MECSVDHMHTRGNQANIHAIRDQVNAFACGDFMRIKRDIS